MRRRWTAAAVTLALAAGGCGAARDRTSEGPLLGAPAAKPGATTTTTLVAALGDSITAGSPAWDPDPAVRQRIGGAADPRSQYGYWAERRLKGTRFRNCGVYGERTDEIAGRLEACAHGVDVLVIQGGINDLAQGRAVEAAADDLRAMVRRGRRLGLRVALVEVLPWNNGYPQADPLIRSLNRLIREIGRSERVVVFPWYGLLDDPAAPGRMRPDLTADGDHPSVEGYRRLAAAVELP